MKLLKYILIILLAFATIPLTGSFTLIPTWAIYIPFYAAALYFLASFVHYHLYVININNKLQNKKTFKLPDTNTVKTVLNIGYGLVLIVFIAIAFYPVLTYPKDTIRISLPDTIDDVSIQTILTEFESEFDTTNSTVYVQDQFKFTINQDQEIVSCDVILAVQEDNQIKTYKSECKNNQITFTHNYYSPRTPSYRLDYTIDDMIASFDSIDFDQLVSNYNLGEHEMINIRVWLGYADSDTFKMKPASNSDHIYEYHLDGSTTEITEETEYQSSQYYVISTSTVTNEGYYDLMSLQYSFVIEYE